MLSTSEGFDFCQLVIGFICDSTIDYIHTLLFTCLQVKLLACLHLVQAITPPRVADNAVGYSRIVVGKWFILLGPKIVRPVKV